MMALDEVKDLLTVIAGYDRRTAGSSDAEAWHRALDDPRIPNLSLTECVDAVILHFQETTDFVMPAHILKRVKAERASAISRAMPALPAGDTGAYAAAGQLWRDAHGRAVARMQARKAAVLAHPDLAQRLTEDPLNFARPDQWNGGIPPKHSPEDASRRVTINDSPRRAALVEIAEEAERRNQAAIARKDTT